MIPKSMSRKTASFDQLIAYMDSEKSDQHFDLHHNCYARGQKNLAGEFFKNSQYLKSRKNGNILYHEIVSITLEDGVEVTYAKECLREIVLKYIAERCPKNMVYGCLHEDHADHLHYHLLISANERGEAKRYWHTKSKYDQIKRDLEEHVLRQYPELKQRRVITADQDTKKQSKKAAEMKRQNKKMTKQEEVRNTILKAMMHTSSLEDFHANLDAAGYAYYPRGKHHGVTVTHDDGQVKKYRFATIGVHESFEEYLAVMQGFADAQATQASQGDTADQDGEVRTQANKTEAPKDEPTQQQTDVPEDVVGEKEKQGEGREPKPEEPTPDADFSVIDDEPISETQDMEPPSFYQEMQDRRARQKQRKEQKSQKRKGKPHR